MTKPKNFDQLRAEKKRAETQLAQEQHKQERLGNRKKYLVFIGYRIDGPVKRQKTSSQMRLNRVEYYP